MPNKKVIKRHLSLKLNPTDILAGILGASLNSSDATPKLRKDLVDRNWASILEWSGSISPQSYESPVSYFRDCQLAALVRKYPFTEDEIPGLNPRDAAVKKFFAAEHRCKRVNQRARVMRKRMNPHAQIYEYARGWIISVIGIKPDMTEILDECNFTAGASLGVHGNKTNIMRKVYAKRWTMTPAALPYALSALWANMHMRLCILPGTTVCYDPEIFRTCVKSKVENVNFNKITFVPKTATTFRSIAVEPLLNGYLQKGVDVVMRRKLRRVDIDLQNQEVNQLLSKAGSQLGSNPYCTIDLSSASDSLAYEVVKDLLPPDWFEFLCDIRAPQYELDDSRYTYEKFCSMGNGFCFPLQTLIFASVCHAVCKLVNGYDNRDFSVYGDDIIVRQNVALLVIEILRDIGFKVNRDKTFITGPFRESCGSDWFNGQDVRPVHITERMVDLRHLFAFHNSTLRSRRCELYFDKVRLYLRSIQGGQYVRPGLEPGDTCYSVPLDTFMLSRNGYWDRRIFQWVWSEIETRSTPDTLKHLNYEEHAKALMLAAMLGSKSSQPYTVRYSGTAYTTKVSRPYSDRYTNRDWQSSFKDASGARTIIRRNLA